MAGLYCRFCAELKPVEGVLNLDSDDQKHNEILVKLTFLNAVYVVLNCNNLPRAVCFDCFDSLNRAYEFLEKVKKAQELLTSIFPQNEPKSHDFDISDDDRGPLDDFFTENDVEKSEIPSETGETLEGVSLQIKIEPKEETLEDQAKNFQNAMDTNYCESEALNVQDILDAALKKAPFTSDVQLYAKEVPNVPIKPKKIKSWREYPWVCSFCDIECLDVETLRTHSKSTHSKCAAYSCIDCKDMKSNDFNVFILHVKMHHKNLRSQCHYCDSVINPDHPNSHLKHHLSHLCCPSCGEIFTDKVTYRRHVKEYTSVKQKRKPRRKAGTPITEEDRTCHICNKVYKNLNSLRDHVKRHKSDRMRNYTCDRCGKTFYNKGTLTCHVMSHDKVRPHICRICNKSFMFPNMLRRHVEMHTGVKPFSCEICGRGFRLQYQLNTHKIIHTDSLPHVCQYCKKAFRFKQILKNHERQHTGAKPYSCEQCFLDFSNWSNYNKHMKRRHNTDTSKKKITPEGVFPVNPETGQIVQLEVHDMEEWKTKVMIPGKRGKKKLIKKEHLDT